MKRLSICALFALYSISYFFVIYLPELLGNVRYAMLRRTRRLRKSLLAVNPWKWHFRERYLYNRSLKRTKAYQVYR